MRQVGPERWNQHRPVLQFPSSGSLRRAREGLCTRRCQSISCRATPRHPWRQSLVRVASAAPRFRGIEIPPNAALTRSAQAADGETPSAAPTRESFPSDLVFIGLVGRRATFISFEKLTLNRQSPALLSQRTEPGICRKRSTPDGSTDFRITGYVEVDCCEKPWAPTCSKLSAGASKIRSSGVAGSAACSR